MPEEPSPSRPTPLVWAPVILVCGLIATSLAMQSRGASVDPAPLREAEAATRALVMDWISEDALARPGGHTYAVDVTQIMAYAAARHDRELYQLLLDRVGRKLIIAAPEREGLPSAHWVGWRHPADASGTTEALRMAEALWMGAEAFGEDLGDLRNLSLSIIRGYERHVGHDQGFWLIRNYYNLATDTFATNSFLVDYDPDFLLRVSQATGEEWIADLARKSIELCRMARAPSGLLRQIIQPELITLMPGQLPFFSANDVEQISNTLTVAERCFLSDPALATRVLDFAAVRWPSLGQYYGATSGQRLGAVGLGIEALGPLLRLAHAAGREELVADVLPKFLSQTGNIGNLGEEGRLYIASEALMTFWRLLPDDRATTTR